MKKNTPKDYKEAIRIKFEKEKDGIYSTHLSNPSQASLRDLCWKIFKSNPETDDLTVYEDFFRFPFDAKDENTSITYTNKFKKVGAFLRGGIEPAKIDTVNFAAILVDYQPRPFRKFKERGAILIEQPIGSPKIPFAYSIKNKSEEEIEIEGFEIEEENGSLNYQEEQIANFDNEETFTYGEEIKNEIENFTPQKPNLDEENKDSSYTTSEIMSVASQQQRPSLFRKIKERILYNFLYRLRNTAIATIFIFGLIITVIYFAFFKNHCMQWSDDHYEVVDCSSKIGKNTNEIIPIDNDLLDFRKLKACDTTTCFKKNGESFVWYGKTPNGVDFFNDNGNGRHPECKSSLRPVTQYMYNKYLKDKPCK